MAREAVTDMAMPYLHAVVMGKDGALDPYCDWARLREVPEGGAFIVRPDGVIAWRTSEVPANRSQAANVLRQALGQVLGTGVNVEPELA